MNRNFVVSKLRALGATAITMVMLGISSTAVAVPFPAAVLPICFGNIGLVATAGPLVDINGVPGQELLVPHRTVVLDLDDDFDFLATSTTTYRLNYYDEGRSLVWQVSGLTVSSAEIMQALAGFDILFVATTFTAPLQMTAFYTLGFTCEGTGIAEVGGESYVVMIGGATAAEGTAMAGTDLSKIRIWVRDRTNGDEVFTHTITGVPGRFLVAGSSGIFDIDGDGDDELVIVRSEYRTDLGDKERVFIHTETFDLLTGTSQGTTQVGYSISFINGNDP